MLVFNPTFMNLKKSYTKSPLKIKPSFINFLYSVLVPDLCLTRSSDPDQYLFNPYRVFLDGRTNSIRVRNSTTVCPRSLDQFYKVTFFIE